MPDGTPLKKLHVDLLVTVGGDGTVLKATHEIANPETPILAVNMGRRGYLTQVQPADFENALSRWMNGDFTLEKQWKVSVKESDHLIGEGLNEAVMVPTIVGKMLSLTVRFDGRRLIMARADGVIIATPTGSTAHAFSAGGPLLESSLDALDLVFIAPLQTVRSLVVPANRRLHILIGESGPSAELVLEGRLLSVLVTRKNIMLSLILHNMVFLRFR